MSKDFRVAVSFFTHKKTVRLIRKLGLDGPWFLLKLWAWAREHCPDGNLEDATIQDIEEAIGWPGESGVFMEAITAPDTLHVVRIDDNYVLHNWEKHNSWAFKSAERSDIARKNAISGWKKRKGKAKPECGDNANGIKSVNAPSPSPSPLPKIKDTVPTLFDEFWKIYPKRNGKKRDKGTSQNKFDKFKPEDQKAIIEAAKNYAASEDAKENFAKDPKRFLTKNSWKDWIEPEEKPAPAQPGQTEQDSEAQRVRNHADLKHAEQWRDHWQDNLRFLEEGTTKHKKAAAALKHYQSEVDKYQKALEYKT